MTQVPEYIKKKYLHIEYLRIEYLLHGIVCTTIGVTQGEVTVIFHQFLIRHICAMVEGYDDTSLNGRNVALSVHAPSLHPGCERFRGVVSPFN